MSDATPKFPLGAGVATPAALAVIREAGLTPFALLRRHQAGDWGDVCPEDGKLNDEAVLDGSSILSVYKLTTGAVVWIITDAADDSGTRLSTTIILPEQY